MAESRMEQLRFIPENGKITKNSNHDWLMHPERHYDSFSSISGIEIQSRIETEKIASGEVAKKIRPELPGLNVKVDLKLEDLHVFKKGNVYVICKDLSVAKKHFGDDYREERVNFTKVNEALKGRKYQVDIIPSQFSTFLKGSEVCVTPNEKFTDEHQGWQRVDSDFSKYFAKPPSDSKKEKEEPDKAIIDFSDDPSWKEYRESVKDNEASVAFGQFLANAGGEDMEKLLDDFGKLDEAFGAELSDNIDDSTIKYMDERKKFNDYLLEFENEVRHDVVYEDDIKELVKNAKKTLESMSETLLEKGFKLFVNTEEGKEIIKLYKNRDDSYSKGSKEAREEIDRRDYHYQDYKASRDKFLTYHFKPNEGIAKEGNELIASMKEKLEKSVKLCDWEASLENKEIEGNFKILEQNEEKNGNATNEQNKQFKEFLASKEGKLTKRLLAEIDYLSNKNFGEGKPLDKAHYQKRKEEFGKAQRNFLNKYFDENGEIYILEEEQRINIIKDLNGNLIATRESLYNEHFSDILNKSTNERDEIAKMQEEFGNLLQDQNLVSEPEHRRELQLRIGRSDQKRLFPARDEIVRASVSDKGHVKECIDEFKNVLNDRIEIVREGIEIAKNPDRTMREEAKKFSNILKDDELPEKLKACLDGEQKDNIEKILEDIRDIDENIPYKLRDGAFRREYNGEITSFVDSIDRFNAPDNSDENASAKDVYSESNNIREFLHKKMFGELGENYQGQDYIKLRDIYSRFSQSDALSGPGWTDVTETDDVGVKMAECRKREFELLKAKDEQTIKDHFSKMEGIAKKSIEVAIKQGKEEVSDALSPPPTTDNEKKRIANLKQLLEDAQKLVKNIEIKQNNMMKSYETHLKATSQHDELIESLESGRQGSMKRSLEDAKELHNSIPENLRENVGFRTEYIDRIKKHMECVNAFEKAKSGKNPDIAKFAKAVQDSMSDIALYVSIKLNQIFENTDEGKVITSLGAQHRTISSRLVKTPELETALKGSGFNEYVGWFYQPEFVLSYFAPDATSENKSEIVKQRKEALIANLDIFIKSVDELKDPVNEKEKELAQKSQELLDKIKVTV